MKNNRFFHWFLLGLFAFGLIPPTSGGNILGDLVKIYSTYEQVNMLLWLTGDVKAERRFGEEVKWITLLTNKRMKEPDTNRWVNTVFNRVKPQFRDRGFNYSVTVLKGGEVNAFAIPGGHIFIYEGMLKFVSSDDELAAILAHELAHAERRHSLKQLRQSTAFNLLLQKAVKNRRDRDTWGQVLGALTMLKFSREDEDEADDLGQAKMTAAGFNPYGQVVVWEKFVQKFGKGETGVLKYLGTHPPSIERVENARKNLVKLGGTVPPPGVPAAPGAPAVMVPVQNQQLVLSYNVLSDEEENLLQNGSFETDLTGKGFPDAWEMKSGKIAPTTAHHATGRKALEMLPESRSTPSRVVSEFIPLHTNQKLNLRGRVKTSHVSQRVSVGAEVYDQKKRLRGYIWPVLAGAPMPPSWSSFAGAFERGTGPQQIPAGAAFIRVILQNGPMSDGPIWFDDLILQRSTYKRPVNLLTNGSFEIEGENEVPLGVSGTISCLKLDLEKPKTGYASVRLEHNPSGPTEMRLAPIPLSELKDGQALHCSFRHMGSAEIEGTLIIGLLDDRGQPLATKILEKEFKAKPNLWEGNAWRAEFRLSPEDRAAARALVVGVSVAIPEQTQLWLDGFILRP